MSMPAHSTAIRDALNAFAAVVHPQHADEVKAALDALLAIEVALKGSEAERKRLCLKVNALLDGIKEHASRAAERRIHASLAPYAKNETLAAPE